MVGGRKFQKEPFGSVFGLGCLLQLAGCWLEYDTGSLVECRILSGIWFSRHLWGITHVYRLYMHEDTTHVFSVLEIMPQCN